MIAFQVDNIASELSQAIAAFGKYFKLPALVVGGESNEGSGYFCIQTVAVDSVDWHLLRRLELRRGDSGMPMLLYGPDPEDQAIRLCLSAMPHLTFMRADLPQNEFIDNLVSMTNDFAVQKDFFQVVGAFETFLGQGDLARAAEFVDSLRASNHDPYLTNLLLARYYFASEDFSNALIHARKGLEEVPNSMAAAALVAAAHQRLGEAAAAQSVTETFLPVAEANLGFLAQLGDIQFEQGRIDQAKEIYHRGFALDPTHKKSAEGLLATSILEGDLSAPAEFSCGRLLHLDLARFCNIRAIALVANGHFALADKLYRNTALLLEGDVAAYKILFNHGLCHKKSGDLEQARFFFQLCKKTAPKEFDRADKQLRIIEKKLRPSA
jgi:tetratricopeptide (TPR) repeat protein